jgi:foldase protein PrsA
MSALGAVLFALVGLSACGGIPGNAVVQVGGTPITKAAFKHWMTVATISGASGTFAKHPVAPEPPSYTACIAHLKEVGLIEREPGRPSAGKAMPSVATLKKDCEESYKSLSQEVLGFLISSQWVIGEASSLRVKLSDPEVRKEFTKIKTQEFPKASEFEKFLATSGQSVSDLLLRVKLNLLSQKIQKTIVKQKSAVTEAQISKYYNENKSKYGTPEKRSVRIILTKTEAAAASAKKEVESGKSFASVASKVSIDPTSKASGGLLKEVVKGEEEKALDTAIFSAKAKVLGGPVKTPFGYYVYEVLSATPGSQQSLSQVKSTIKQQLVATGEQSALSKFVKEFKTKWMGKTECRSGYMAADCKGYKAPKTSGTAKSVE